MNLKLINSSLVTVADEQAARLSVTEPCAQKFCNALGVFLAERAKFDTSNKVFVMDMTMTNNSFGANGR